MRQVIDYYQSRLKQTPAALEYLQKRGINSSEALERFQIGLSDRSLGLRLPRNNVKDGREIRGRLQELGVYRSSGHEHFNGCIVFPVITVKGLITEIYGRRLARSRDQSSPHLYLPGPHKGVWNEAALSAGEEVILCESIIDALTFWCAGFRNVTTSYGINGFTPDHVAAFQRHNVRRVLIAYDSDAEGDSKAHALSEELIGSGFECFRLRFPKGMDANEYALKVTPASQSLALVIRKAEWLGKGPTPSDRKTRRAKEKAAGADGGSSSVDESTSNGSSASAAGSCSSADEASPSSAEGVTLEDAPAPSSLARPPEGDATPAASPVPQTAAPEIEAEVRENEILLPIGNRCWRVRGLEKNLAFDVLKVNVLVRKGEAFYVDTLDLYAARSRSVFVREAAKELAVEEATVKKDLGRVLLALEGLQEKQIQEALAVKEDRIELSDSDKQAALELLVSKNLVDRILKDFERCGVVGEETNKLFGYLAATSRKLDQPLAVVIQSSSAAGKSWLMDAVLRFMPPEEQVSYSAMTGQSLFYMGSMDLKHKVLAIAEEEGVHGGKRGQVHFSRMTAILAPFADDHTCCGVAVWLSRRLRELMLLSSVFRPSEVRRAWLIRWCKHLKVKAIDSPKHLDGGIAGACPRGAVFQTRHVFRTHDFLAKPANPARPTPPSAAWAGRGWWFLAFVSGSEHRSTGASPVVTSPVGRNERSAVPAR